MIWALLLLQNEVLDHHKDMVLAAAYSPDGKTLATADGDLYLTDTATWGAGRYLGSHGNQVGSLAWSSDGKLLVSGSWNGTVKIFDVAEGKELAYKGGHKDAVSVVAISPDGTLVASGDWNGHVLLWTWDGRALVLLADVAHGDKGIGALVFDKSNRLVAADWSGLVRSYSDKGQKGTQLKLKTTGCRYLAFSSDGQRLMYGEGGHQVRVHFFNRAQPQVISDKAAVLLSSGAMSGDGKIVVGASSWQGQVWVWDGESGKPIQTLNEAKEEAIVGVSCVALSPDRKTVVLGRKDGKVSIERLK